MTPGVQGPFGVARAEVDEDPCATPSPTSTASTTTAPGGTQGTGSGNAGGPLARTGADAAGILGLGCALLAAGCAVVFTVRRSQRSA